MTGGWGNRRSCHLHFTNISILSLSLRIGNRHHGPRFFLFLIRHICINCWWCSVPVVECWTRDRRAAGSSLTSLFLTKWIHNNNNVKTEDIEYLYRHSTTRYRHDKLASSVSIYLYSVLTTSTAIILGTRKCGPCQERVFIYFKLQEAIEAVIQLDLWKKDHSRIITE